MYALLFIARNNIKKKKGDATILFLLILLSSLILYVSISVLTNLDNVLEQAHETFHGADFLYVTLPKDETKVAEVICGQEEVAEYQITDAWFQQGGTSYRKNKEAEKNEYLFLFETIEEERDIGRLPDELVKKSTDTSILLPYCLKTDRGFAVGDTIYISFGNQEYEFQVSGFVEDPMFASTINVSVYKCYVPENYLQKIISAEPSLEESHYIDYQVRLKAGADISAFDDKVNAQLTKTIPDLSNSVSLWMNWEMMKSADSMLSKIAMAIMLVFSVLLIIIALIIVRFSIRNFIEENMKNIGVLEAFGYTTKQLQASSLLEMFGIAAASAISGVALGAVGSDFIGNIQASMLGLSWNQSFDIRAAGVSILVVIGLVLGITLMVSRIYGKVTVLSALRGGIHTHNFRKNHLAFEKTILPMPFSLGFKKILQEKMKNFAVLFIVMLLSFACCVGFFLYENFSRDTDNLLKMMGLEQGTAWINGVDLESAGEQIKKLEGIDKVLYYDNCSVQLTYGENQAALTCSMWSEPEGLINEIVVEGRLPRYENEIAVTTIVSDRLGAQIGDIIYVEGTGERLDYVICGIDQKVTDMGQKAMMSLAGAKRLNGKSQVTTLYLYGKDGVTFDQIKREVTAIYPDFQLVDSKKQISDSTKSATAGMELICLIFVMITIGVVTMVVMLLIKTRVTNERKNYGIQKALGFTTPQLILQTILTNLPVDFAGALIGAILARYLSNSMVTMGFSFCGIKKSDLVISPFWLVLTVIGILIVALAAAVLSSAKIRKIEPVKLLQEDY